ncbi:hypothetical protein GGQ54_002232 [Naumannella cuiyingiana]|uniref:Uncharacterized protein n=1 Tax=Naumannella cuiyingiana TaxID=1347891 RepID=A0A7Z0D9Z5_9ACTN|nr:hypothetical protein [Naumannella cuiyingiana]NYI71672.1 hypothetical protein [Naumannella cuiyingiana]
MQVRPRSGAMVATLVAALIGLGCLVGLPSAHAEDTVAFTVNSSDLAPPAAATLDTDARRYWMARASGPGQIVAVNDSGEAQGSAQFGAQTEQVRALAYDAGRVFVGDIGDESRQREFVTVYFLNEPSPEGGSGNYRSYDFSYPEGPQDARAMFVRDGRVFIVTWGDKPGIYSTAGEPTRQGVNRLERLGDAPANVTDAVTLSDGRVALRTYTSVIVLNGEGARVASGPTPWQSAGEMITRDTDGESILLGNAGERADFLRAALPEGLTEVPEAPATPPPSPEPPASPEQSGEQQPAPGPGEGGEGRDTGPVGEDRTGTLIALVLAGLVAVAAAVIVLRSRPPVVRDGRERPRVTLTESADEPGSRPEAAAPVAAKDAPAAKAPEKKTPAKAAAKAPAEAKAPEKKAPAKASKKRAPADESEPAPVRRSRRRDPLSREPARAARDDEPGGLPVPPEPEPEPDPEPPKRFPYV